MHFSSMLRMTYFVKNYVKAEHKKVLDVGSYDVNGSYKILFPSTIFDYTGLDMANGPNVDYVPDNPYRWSKFSDCTFDVIISGQAFEHMEFFWITMQEMARVLKVGGYLCIVAPHGFGKHRYPVDCYRFFADGMIALARYTNLTPVHASTNCAPPDADAAWYSATKADSFLIARKEHENYLFDCDKYLFEVPQPKDYLTGFIPFTQK